MNFDQYGIPLRSLVSLFLALLVIGTAITIPLFKFDIHRFLKSKLAIKILFWIPIFLTFVFVLYANEQMQVAVLLALLLATFFEIFKVFRTTKYKGLVAGYFLIFAVSLLHFYLIDTNYKSDFTNILISICFATVLADVTAFFFGNYLGRHKLPSTLNKNKSWEGVFGQILGALIGVLLVNWFVLPIISIWLFVPIGIGSALGDLANSFVKRRVSIKDWSKAIPGHGGFTDRFSSIAGSVFLTFYFLKIII